MWQFAKEISPYEFQLFMIFSGHRILSDLMLKQKFKSFRNNDRNFESVECCWLMLLLMIRTFKLFSCSILERLQSTNNFNKAFPTNIKITKTQRIFQHSLDRNYEVEIFLFCCCFHSQVYICVWSRISMGLFSLSLCIFSIFGGFSGFLGADTNQTSINTSLK